VLLDPVKLNKLNDQHSFFLYYSSHGTANTTENKSQLTVSWWLAI